MICCNEGWSHFIPHVLWLFMMFRPKDNAAILLSSSWNHHFQGLLHNDLIPGNSLLFRERLFWFYAFLSVSMGVWTNRGKQLILAALCFHFATSLIKFCSLRELPVSDALCSALLWLSGFVQRCGLRSTTVPVTFWQRTTARGPEWRVFTGTLVRRHGAIQPNVRQKQTCSATQQKENRSGGGGGVLFRQR